MSLYKKTPAFDTEGLENSGKASARSLVEGISLSAISLNPAWEIQCDRLIILRFRKQRCARGKCLLHRVPWLLICCFWRLTVVTECVSSLKYSLVSERSDQSEGINGGLGGGQRGGVPNRWRRLRGFEKGRRLQIRAGGEEEVSNSACVSVTNSSETTGLLYNTMSSTCLVAFAS